MEPIIDPMFFYWIDVCGGLKIVAGGSAVAVVASAIALVLHAAPLDDDMQNAAKRSFKWLAAILVISAAVATFTPTRQTLILMQVAKNITPDNLQTMKQLTGDVQDSLKADVIDIIEAVTQKEKETK